MRETEAFKNITEAMKLPFDERVEWIESLLDKIDNVDEITPLISTLLFSEEEIKKIGTMKKRLRNLNVLLGKC